MFFLLALVLWCYMTGSAHAAFQSTPDSRIPQARVAIEEIELPVREKADIRFRRLSGADDPAKSNAGPFVQDNQGFIWFGTPYGLNRFDGYTYKVFTHDPANPMSISGSYINAIFKDRRGVIWVGCNQFLNEFDSETETFKKFPIPFVVNISQDSSGMLWLSTTTGLYALDADNGNVRRYIHESTNTASLDSSDIKSSGEDKNGTFWVATSEGFDQFDRHAGKVTLRIPIHEASHPFSFYEDRFGVFWIYHVSGNPLAIFDRKTNTLTNFSFKKEGSRSGTLTGISGMVEDQSGHLWLSTHGAGMLRFDRDHRTFLRYSHSQVDHDSIAEDGVNHMFADREGNIWLSLGAFGLSRFTPKTLPFKRYRRDFGDSGGQDQFLFVGAIYEDHHGVLWIGTHDGLHRVDRVREQYRTYVLNGYGRGSDVISICEDRSGYLWLGTYSHGLFRFDPRTGQSRRFQHVSADSRSLSSDIVPRVFLDHKGTIWAATYDGIDRYDEVRDEFTTYRVHYEGVSPHYIEMVEAPDLMMWLGTESSGLERFDPSTGEFTTFQHKSDQPSSLASDRVNSIHFDRSGSMWVGTQEGLDNFDQHTSTFRHYTQKDGLPGIVVSCVLEDDNGHLWMSTDNGVATLNPQAGTIRSYSIADGLPGPDLTGWGTGFKSVAGEMFFGGFSGATAFFPNKLSESFYAPPIVLTDFKLFGISVSPGRDSPLKSAINYTREISLTHKQNVFSIGFAALSYLNPSTNRYRYMLEGLDRGWIDVGSDQRFATYTTLPPGTYTFRVEGATSRGEWGEPGSTLRIVILPAWWTTWWFRAIYVTVLLLVILGIYRLHIQQIATEHNIRLKERLNERARISRELHDTLLQGFQGLALRFHSVMKTLPTDSAARASIEDILDRTDEVLLEGRESVRELREHVLPEDDLANSLAACGEYLIEDEHPRFSVAVLGTVRPLNSTVCSETYRIGREGIINAFKHAHAKKIEVEICFEASYFRMMVRDDGIGIDEAVLNEGRANHWGLSGMRERAQRIGGTLKLWSRPHSGTEVELTIAAKVAYQPEPKRLFWQRFGAISQSAKADSEKTRDET